MTRMRVAMGTWLTIEACAFSHQEALAALEAAFAVVLTLDSQLHPHRPGSDLERVRACALHVPQVVQPGTWDLLALAKRISALSAGIFDPCLPECPGTLADVELVAGPAVICRAPVALDLGGIAKGYAIDQAVATLQRHGCTAGLVNAGGDMRVFGSQARTVMLRRADGSCEELPLANAALAVSARSAGNHPREHQGYYVRVPRFEAAAEPCHAAVLAPEAATADALTKCVLLCPPALAAEVLGAFGAQRISA